MRERSLIARREKLLREEAVQPEMWWWLSFADTSGFLGGILIKASGFATAIQMTHKLGINPGGEVKGVPMETIPHEHEQHANKLLSRNDIATVFGEPLKWA